MDKKHTQRLYIRTSYGDHLSIFEPDEKKGFIVTVPGLPGVVTWGKNIAHAKKMAREAIELCVECRAEETMRHATTRLSHPLRRIETSLETSRRIKAGSSQKTRELVAA